MIVTFSLWRVPRDGLPRALARVARSHLALRSSRDVRFGKMLGTGDGRTFTLRDATPDRWALLAVWADAAAPTRSALLQSWESAAAESWRITLLPLAARGRWSGREPFGRPAPRRYDGPVAALTRARIAPSKILTFWRAVPPVVADLHRSPGLRLALGVGEVPVGLQGTFSLWDSAAAMSAFAHRGRSHLEAIRRTTTEGWYAEELFARFAVVNAAGTVDGDDPLGER